MLSRDRALSLQAVFPALRSLAALIALASLLIALAMPATAQGFRFSNVQVDGNTRISDASVLATAGITPGQTLSAAQVNDALQRLQSSGLFLSVEIVPRGNTAVITVEEFPTINQIAIEGNDRLSDENLRELVTSQERQVYSPSRAEADAEAIAEAYRASGRLTATVTPTLIRRPDNRVDLVFEVAEGGVIETQRIAFVGNRAYSDRRLRRVLESTQAGVFRQLVNRDTFIADRIAFDRQLLTDFYQDRGYVDFQILSVTPELSRNRDAYFVTFNIREGQSFDLGQITTVSEIPEADAAEFQDAIRIRPGVTYSPRLIDSTISRLENLATNQGLRFVRVEPRFTRNAADLTIDVEFAIVRGERVFVERIDIEGNSTTLDRVIRRQFDTVEGDPFDPRAVRAAAERIRATGFFADVEVEGRPGSAADQVIVDVDVEEAPTGSLGFAGTFSTDVGFGLGVSFSERNFLGRGQAVALSFNTTSGSQAFNFSFTEPAFLRRDLSLGTNIFYNQTSDQNREFDTEDYGFNVGLGFPVSEYGRSRLSYGLENNTISGFNAATSSPIIGADQGSRVVSYIGAQYSYDTIGTGLDPTTGVNLELDVQLAGLGGDAQYVRTTALAVAQRQVAREDVTLRASFEAGALQTLNGNSHFNDRFFLSSRQMRGFQPFGLGPRDTGAPNRDALGGNYFTVARFEAGFPLGLPDEYNITGGVFADVGSVWGLDNTAGFAGPVDDSFALRSTIGFSVFWETPIGPLRFNFSSPVMNESFDETRNFDFSVETRF
ncbi:MAG: outer membrane protein assembly factor BamA [Rhodobacteraceae bacterium]|nr:outer membrane protein assembly factor BamA [Paracoccaceae bacterium]